MIDFENEKGIVDKPNVKLLYEIIHDYLAENDVSTMDFVSLLVMMIFESVAGTYDPKEDEDDNEP